MKGLLVTIVGANKLLYVTMMVVSRWLLSRVCSAADDLMDDRPIRPHKRVRSCDHIWHREVSLPVCRILRLFASTNTKRVCKYNLVVVVEVVLWIWILLVLLLCLLLLLLIPLPTICLSVCETIPISKVRQ